MGGLVGVWRAGAAETGEATGDTFVGLHFLRFFILSLGSSSAARFGASSGEGRVEVGVAASSEWR